MLHNTLKEEFEHFYADSTNFLFIYGLFNDAVSSSDYKESTESATIREIRMGPL
jgi:hypothetical protein